MRKEGFYRVDSDNLIRIILLPFRRQIVSRGKNGMLHLKNSGKTIGVIFLLLLLFLTILTLPPALRGITSEIDNFSSEMKNPAKFSLEAPVLATSPFDPQNQIVHSTASALPPSPGLHDLLWNSTFGGIEEEIGHDLIECQGGGFALAGSIRSQGEGLEDMWLVRTDVAGNQIWNSTFGGTNLDVGWSLVECDDGGFALAGYTSSYGAGNTDFWLVRTDASGNHLWDQTYGDVDDEFCYAVIECDDGGFALAGYTSSYGAGNTDFWLVRTDAGGNHLWNQTYGGADYDYGYSIVECIDGNFTLVGSTFSSGVGSSDAWLVHTDPTGNHLWDQTYGYTDYEVGNDLVASSDTGYTFVGYTNSTGGGDEDCWLVHTDSIGNHLWNHTYRTSNPDRGYSLIECEGGGYALTGDTFRDYDVDTDIWLIRTDQTGTILWNRKFGGVNDDYGYALIECRSADFAITGSTLSFGAGSEDVWLIRTDSMGEALWHHTYGGTSSDEASYLIECSNGDFVFAGETHSWGSGQADFWLVRTNSNGNHLWNHTYGGDSDDVAYEVVECTSGGFAIIGKTFSFGAGSADVWLVRTDANGNHLWNRTYGGIDNDHGYALVESNEGGFTILGDTRNFGAGARDAWLVHTDLNGNPLWNHTFGGVDYDEGLSLAKCSDGGYAMLCTTNSFGAGSRDWWLVRTDAAGNHLWNQTYGTAGTEDGYSVIECRGGGFAMTGYIVRGAGHEDVWLVRTDDAGNHLWNQTFGGPIHEYGQSVIELSTGGFAIIGTTNSFGGGIWDILFVQMDAMGNYLKHQTFGGTEYERGYGLVECQGGGYALAGYTTSRGAGSTDAWLIRIDIAGNHLWYKNFGGTSSDYGYALVECGDGGFAIAGRSYSFESYYWAWLVRTDANGNYLWDQNYGRSNAYGYIYDMVECSDGGFALLGYIYILSSINRYDAWLIRTDALGNHLWNKTYHNYYSDYGYALVECSDGGFAITGYTYGSGSGNYYDAWLLRTDADGNYLWDNTYHRGQYDYGRDVVECSDGGFAIVGYNYNSGSYSNFWLIRTDANGNYLWDQTFGGMYSDYGWALVQCSDDGFALVGVTSGFGAGSYDALLIRTNAAGNLLWYQTYGGSSYEYVYAITLCTGDGFAITGYTYSYGAGSADMWLIRTNAMGQYLWDQTFGGTSGDYGYDLVECGDGGFALAGYTYSIGVGSSDLFLVRVQPIQWVQTPSDQLHEFGYHFRYDLNATSFANIDSWWVNDTSNFSIDSQGVITNATALSIGSYGLQVRVNDTSGDFRFADFLVTVQDTTPPVWITEPTNQMVELGGTLDYQLAAWDASGIDSWIINDTLHFNIGSNGRITSVGILTLRVYWLQVWVNDTLNQVLTGTFAVIVQDTTPPTLTVTPSNQIIQYGTPFSYQLHATDLSGIHHWSINDTTHFIIDNSGLIMNNTILLPGTYHLLVSAYDSRNNFCTAIFTVTVEGYTAPPLIPPVIPFEWILAIAGLIAVVAILGAVFWYRRRTRK